MVDNLLHHDPFLVLADYRFIDCQRKVSAAWLDDDTWSPGCRSSTPPAAEVLPTDRAIEQLLRRHLERRADAGDAVAAQSSDSLGHNTST